MFPEDRHPFKILDSAIRWSGPFDAKAMRTEAKRVVRWKTFLIFPHLNFLGEESEREARTPFY